MSRAVRSFLHRQSTKQGKQLIRLRIPFKDSLKSYKLIGSFTESAWTDELNFIYSISSKEYYLELWLRTGDSFLVKSSDEEILLDEYPSKRVLYIQDQYGRYVNFIPHSLQDYHNQLRLQTFLESYTLRKEKSIYLKGSFRIIKKDDKPCEDRCFLNRFAFGVADGVSAWRHQGIDSGVFAEDFLSGCEMSIDRYLRYHYSFNTSDILHKSMNEYSYSSDDTSESDRHKDFLKEIASEALSRTYSYGSCTFLLGVLEGSLLKICSLGDGSVLILRFVDEKPVILLKTNAQQHSFNTPFQICNSPPNSGHEYISDSPNEGDSYEVSLTEGDIIVAGSDGLWDNLYLQDIIYIVQLHKADIHKLAKVLAYKAYQLSKSNAKTPFEEEVADKYGEGHWKGGKPDDISVVTAIVSK